MAYSLTSATNPKTLLAAIVTFATAQGWTINYNHANGVGSSFGGQIGLSSVSGDCHVTIGEQSATQNPIAVSGALGADTDGRIYMSLSDSITNTLIQFWGHPGSIVTSATDGDRVTINDIYGPMDEVHFFGDGTYILVAVKCDAQRYTAFGFGELDDKGMGLANKPAFAFSNYQNFWDTSSDFSGQHQNASLATGHAYLGVTSPITTNFMLRLPNGILDTGIGFASGIIYANMSQSGQHIAKFLCRNQIYPGQNINNTADGSFYLDQMFDVGNTPTTGGVPLWTMPVLYNDTVLHLHSYVGDIPGIRACRITSLVAAQEIVYGSETHKVFPWKQKGTVADSGFGGTYDNQPNSFDMGWAMLKN